MTRIILKSATCFSPFDNPLEQFRSGGVHGQVALPVLIANYIVIYTLNITNTIMLFLSPVLNKENPAPHVLRAKEGFGLRLAML